MLMECDLSSVIYCLCYYLFVKIPTLRLLVCFLEFYNLMSYI